MSNIILVSIPKRQPCQQQQLALQGRRNRGARGLHPIFKILLRTHLVTIFKKALLVNYRAPLAEIRSGVPALHFLSKSCDMNKSSFIITWNEVKQTKNFLSIVYKIIFHKDIILFVTSNHQTTNIVFPNFFPEFFSASAVEEENKLFIGPKQRKKTVLDQ